MAVKRLLVLAFLTQVLCEKHSVTFVIHDTFSVVDDIKQVKNATKLIMDMASEKASEIEDYVLVTFNDPGTVLKKKTRDPKVFQQSLNSIKVHGYKAGCHENVLSGIKRALNESSEGSSLYVFTDASARDYDLLEEVKAICQKKKSQIYFIVSGHCGDISTRRHQVYHDIAAACNGQAITVHRKDVDKVPAYLKEMFKADMTVLESAVLPAYRWRSINVNIDDLIENTIISASGIDIDLKVYKYNAKKKPIRNHEMIWTRNFKVIQPFKQNGVYTVMVKGQSPVELTIMARTKFTFEYGFSIENVTSLKATDPQPFTDIKTHLTIFAKDPEGSAEVRGVELHHEGGKVWKPLTRVRDNVYVTEKFLSPEQAFKIAVVATAKKTGKTANSFAKTLVIPIQPDSVEQIQVKGGGSIDIHCRTPSTKTKAQRTWYMKKPKDNDFSVLKDQTKEVLHVKNPVAKDYYKCVARNATGVDQYNGQIDILARPQFIFHPFIITKNIGDNTTIECKIFNGNPRPEVKWHFKHENSTTFEEMGQLGETFYIPSVQLDHVGEYCCLANSTEGTDKKTTKLVVQVPPEVLKTDDHFTIKEGTSIDVKCSILKGTPKPVITWYSRRQDASDFEEIVEETNETLHVVNAKFSKTYKCEANNSAGSDFNTVGVDVEARPEFRFSTPNITVNEGDPVTIDCKLRKGSSPFERSWERKLKDMASFKLMRHEGEELNILAAELSHVGEYKCVVENSEGRAEKITELIIRAAPVIENVAPNETVLESSNVNLQCRITKGVPKPIVNWFYKHPKMPQFVNMSKTSENLLLDDVQLSHAGQYKCVVENEVGKVEQVVELVVKAPPKVVFVPPNSAKHSAVEGDPSIRLPCAAGGLPAPTITWLVDNKAVGLEQYERVHVEGNALVIPNPKEADSSSHHTYVCQATNELGQDTQTYEVLITDHIEVSKVNETYGIYKQPYDVRCSLPYTDPNLVKWYKNSKLIPDKSGPLLHFDDPTEADSANYTCRVGGVTDSGSQTIQVMFGLPPTRDQLFNNVEWKGDEKSISCYSFEYPEGKYEWFYNGKKIGWNKETINITEWGEYICNVKNPLGSLDLIFKVTTAAKGCRVPKSLFTSEHAPLVLDSSSSWPILQTVHGHFILPYSEKLQLVCQDDSNSPSQNSFTMFPNLKSVYATCEDDSFLVDGSIWKMSEFECKRNVVPGVKQTKIPCLGEKTELMQVGFSVNGFTEVYQTCLDLNNMLPLYTKLNTIPAERTELRVVADESRKESCADESKCCYESIQLVNPIDVSFGPAKSATLLYSNPLNSVNYCKLKNDFDWDSIEMISRSEIPYTVWTGAAKYVKVDIEDKTKYTPRYLWKVLRYNSGSDEEMIAIIHENVDKPGPRLCAGACGNKTAVFEPARAGRRTYCCSMDDFKQALGVNVDFNL